MKPVIAGALLRDAYYQVLDNKVFRLLVLLSIVLVAPTFLIGFREDGIHVLFGWSFISYEEFFRAAGVPLPQVRNLHVDFIQGLQSILVQGLAGSVGIMFCIAATAFFVPRMLERGAADTLFSKPISRFTLLASRYFAGLLFVAILSFLLILGMHVGLLVTSGYSDPAFLWSALTLVYVYALVQSVSIVVAVFTRSSVAAILTTLVFYTFNGCIHGLWVAKEHGRERTAEPAEVEPGPGAQEAKSFVMTALTGTLDVLHYTLPMTSDADILTKKLRTMVAGRRFVLEDPTGRLSVERDPEGFERAEGVESQDLLASPAVWIATGPEGADAGRISLARRSRLVERPAPAGRKDDKPRTMRQSASAAAAELVKSLEGRPEVAGKPAKEREPSSALSFEIVRWREDDASGRFDRERAFLAVDDWIFEVDARLQSDGLPEADRWRASSRFRDGFRVLRDDADYLDPGSWYEKRLDWRAPLKFNVFFSIASSLVFAAAAILLSAWRLRRIDF